MATHKSLSLMGELKDVLKVRLASLAQTESFDSSGNPCVLIGAAAAGSTGAFIRVKPVESLFKNSIGNSQEVFTPHIVQVAVEANPAGGAGADVNTWAVLLPLVGSAVLKGAKVEMWVETNGSVPALTTFNTAAKKIATFDPHPYHPLTIGQ